MLNFIHIRDRRRLYLGKNIKVMSENENAVLKTLSVILKISEQQLCLMLEPEFNQFQPLFEIDINSNILIQGKKIGRLNKNREVIFEN